MKRYHLKIVRNWKVGLAISLFVSIFFYAYFIEPNWIEVNRYQLGANIEKEILMAHISDIHTVGLGFLERRMFKLLEEIEPDVIVITGDISTEGGTVKGYRDVLLKFKAPRGVYFVKGNWEYWNPIKNLERILHEGHIILLNNKNIEVAPNIFLVGFDDTCEGKVDLESAFHNLPQNSFKVALFHSPSFYNDIFTKIDLALSGHSHGGQVQLPFLGPLWTPFGTGEFEEGWFKKGPSKMYVTRGIGTSIFNIRFFSRPEIVLLKLVPKHQNYRK